MEQQKMPQHLAANSDVKLRQRSSCSHHRLQTCSSFLFISNLAISPAPFSLKDADWSFWAQLKNDSAAF